MIFAFLLLGLVSVREVFSVEPVKARVSTTGYAGDLTCQVIGVKEDPDYKIHRCENDEVICYLSIRGLSCHFKEGKEPKTDGKVQVRPSRQDRSRH